MLQDHEVHEHAYLVFVAGELEIQHDGGTESAGPGYVAHWEPHERHEVRAKTDSRFLLVLAPWPNPEDRTTSLAGLTGATARAGWPPSAPRS